MAGQESEVCNNATRLITHCHTMDGMRAAAVRGWHFLREGDQAEGLYEE